jgi:hypothetical protein
LITDSTIPFAIRITFASFSAHRYLATLPRSKQRPGELPKNKRI